LSGLEEVVVADKGYHSNQALVDLEAVGVRSYISEPDRGRRTWKNAPDARDAVYQTVVAAAAAAGGLKGRLDCPASSIALSDQSRSVLTVDHCCPPELISPRAARCRIDEDDDPHDGS